MFSLVLKLEKKKMVQESCLTVKLQHHASYLWETWTWSFISANNPSFPHAGAESVSVSAKRWRFNFALFSATMRQFLSVEEIGEQQRHLLVKNRSCCSSDHVR